MCLTFCVVAGGRFKKEVVIDGQSYLLLIRDEGSAPEMQVSAANTLHYHILHSSHYIATDLRECTAFTS